MDREATKKVIEVMQAYVDGAEIEIQTAAMDDDWMIEEPAWDFIGCLYRIKPKKPRKVSVAASGGCSYPVSAEGYSCIELTPEVRAALEAAEIDYVD